MGKFLGGIIVLLIIVALVFKGCGSGWGLGKGSGKENNVENTETSDDTEQKGDEEKDIIVKIEEDKVTIGEKEFKDAEELREYLEETNNDEKKYELEEDKSILATHEWVLEVFESLQIPLKGIK